MNKICPVCNQSFHPKTTRQIFCSRSCAAKIARKKQIESGKKINYHPHPKRKTEREWTPGGIAFFTRFAQLLSRCQG